MAKEDQRTGPSSEEKEYLRTLVEDMNLDEDEKKAIVKVISDSLFKNSDVVVEEAERNHAGRGQLNAPDVVWLYVVGLLLVAATLAGKAWQLFFHGYSALLPGYSALLPSEFITGISLGTILIVFAAGFEALPTMYELKARAESVRIHLKNRAQIIQILAESRTRTTGQRNSDLQDPDSSQTA